MPRSTGLGQANKSSSGNSGNKSTSHKPSNKKAVAVRNAKPEDADIDGADIEEHQIQSPPGQAQAKGSAGMVSTQSAATDGGVEFDRDRYRKAREIDEWEDDTPAKIQIRGVFDGKEIVSDYTNFMLQAVSEAEQEKYQIVETFTAYYAFFYGKRPPIYTYSGVLLSDKKSNWAATFKFMYENYFRGTATAELGAQAYITYGKKVVSGFLLNLNMQQEAMSPNGIPFSFSMLVISYDLAEFGDDFKKFMDEQLARLAELKAAAAQKIRELNSNPDTRQKGLMAMVLNGKLPPLIADKIPGTQKVEPPSNKPKTLTQTADSLAQQVLDGRPSTFNDLKSSAK